MIKWKALSFLNCVIRFICAIFDRLGDGCLVVEGICDLGPRVCGYKRSGWVFLFRYQLLRPFPTLSVPLWEVPGSDALQGRAPDYMTNTVIVATYTPPTCFFTHYHMITFAHSLTWHLAQAHRVSCECTLVLLPLTQVRAVCFYVP